MYYYTFKDDSELTRDNVVKTLESLGYKKNKFSCNLKDAKGIALYFSYDEGKHYIFLSENMMNPDPRFGWVEPYRKEVKELMDFYNVCRDLA